MTSKTFDYEYNEREHVKGAVVVGSDGVHWTERPNPHPIVSTVALKVMERLRNLEDQFFARELVNKRHGSKHISYESCPKGSSLSAKEHKTSMPGPFHNCLFDHLGSGSDYSIIPGAGATISSTTCQNARGDLKSPRSSRRKTREDCDKCSSVSFTGEDANTCYETYLRQHTYAHLQPDGPPIKKPIQHPSEPLRLALKTAKSLDDIKRALLPSGSATVSPSTPSNWLEELKVHLDPSKRHKVFESSSSSLPKPLRPSSLSKPRRGFRLLASRTSVRPTLTRSRQTKISNSPAPMVKFRFSGLNTVNNQIYKPLEKIEQSKTSKAAATVDVKFAKFVTDRNRYLKKVMPKVANLDVSEAKPDLQKADVNIKPTKNFTKGSGDSSEPSTSRRTEAEAQKELSALLAQPKLVKTKKLSTQKKVGGKSIKIKLGKKKSKASHGATTVSKPPKQKPNSVKKKKTAKSKPVVHKGFGFEFKSTRKTNPKISKSKSQDGIPLDRYTESIIKMLEKQEAEKSKEIRGENSVDERGDTDRLYQKRKVRIPISLRQVKTRVKKKVQSKTGDLTPSNEPMVVLYQKQDASAAKPNRPSPRDSSQHPTRDLKENSTLSTPLEILQKGHQQSSREKFKLPAKWVKKNWLILPVGIKETVFMPSPRQSLNYSKPRVE